MAGAHQKEGVPGVLSDSLHMTFNYKQNYSPLLTPQNLNVTTKMKLRRREHIIMMGMYKNTYPTYSTYNNTLAQMHPNHVRIRRILTPHAPMHMYYYHLLGCSLHYTVVVFIASVVSLEVAYMQSQQIVITRI